MKARIRFRPRTVEGIACPFPVVTLRVQDRYGALAELDFRVDTQADFTSIPVPVARRYGIAFSRGRERGVAGLVGQTTAYRDRVQIVIAGRTHDWPCEFVNIPPALEPQAERRLLLPALGRAGFLDEYAVHIESDYLIITRIGPIRRWLRRRLHSLWTLLGRVHPEGRPL